MAQMWWQCFFSSTGDQHAICFQAALLFVVAGAAAAPQFAFDDQQQLIINGQSQFVSGQPAVRILSQKYEQDPAGNYEYFYEQDNGQRVRIMVGQHNSQLNVTSNACIACRPISRRQKNAVVHSPGKLEEIEVKMNTSKYCHICCQKSYCIFEFRNVYSYLLSCNWSFQNTMMELSTSMPKSN